jgi:nucleoside-diphosphate-sugar epimerase
MRILITGSEGSLMQAVIPKLLAQGYEIVGVDNLYRYGKTSERANVDYELRKLDLDNRHQTLRLCQGFDAVFLAAAKLYGVGGFNHYCADIIADDTAVQGNILKSCVDYGVERVVYTSSSMVYETCVQDVMVPVTEDMVDDCIMPKTEYGLSKLIGERMCQAFKKQYGLNYTIWRPFNILTPHEKAMSEQGFSHVFADYITNIVEKRLNPLPIIGDGNQIRCFTWIDDIAEIIAQHSFSAQTLDQAYNICNVEPISMRELALKIYTAAGFTDELAFNTVKEYANDVRVRIPSVDKLINTIGHYEFKNVDYSIKQCLDNL